MQQLLLIYTGGTIGMVEDKSTGVLKTFNFDNLLQQIPQLKNVDAKIDTISIATPKDSAEMHPEDWQYLSYLIYSKYEDYNAFVVLHGTDTMAYTASALSFMFQNLNKPILLTGSQLPIGNIRTDAVENVLTTIQLALLQKKGVPLIREVGLYFGSKLLRGNRSSKLSANQFNAFDSPNYSFLASSGVSLKLNEEYLLDTSVEKQLEYKPKLDISVFLLKIHPGITSFQFNVIVNSLGVKALVLETYGTGTLFTDKWFVDGLIKFKENGGILINCTQCVEGGVEGFYDSNKILSDLEVINAKNMTTEAVLVKTMHLLAYTLNFKAFKNAFKTPISGEIS